MAPVRVVACAVALLALAACVAHEPAAARPAAERADVRPAPVGLVADAGPGPAEPTRSPRLPDDGCAAFYEEQRTALSPAEHQRLFGCPPCPCACVGGQITCAPCAVCQPSPPKKR